MQTYRCYLGLKVLQTQTLAEKKLLRETLQIRVEKSNILTHAGCAANTLMTGVFAQPESEQLQLTVCCKQISKQIYGPN